MIFNHIALKLKYQINPVYKISYNEEAKLDLFIEYLIPNIINTIEESFYFLIKKGIKKQQL